MLPYGKVAQAAVAAASVLAENYHADPRPVLSSREIARQRNLSQTLVAKVLTQLSQAGLVSGSPGPGGGYALSRAPADITLAQIVSLFDRKQDALMCPYGPGWCGTGPQCPLHEQLDAIRTQLSDCLEQTDLSGFTSRPPRSR
jgi:Rrf2 family protein